MDLYYQIYTKSEKTKTLGLEKNSKQWICLYKMAKEKIWANLERINWNILWIYLSESKMEIWLYPLYKLVNNVAALWLDFVFGIFK